VPAEDSPAARREAAAVHHRRSGVPGRGGPVALPGPVEQLPDRPGHPPAMAPRALEDASPRPVPPARSSSPRSLDQGADPSDGRENPRWGYLRIRGELLKLGVDVSHTTVATVLRQSGLGPAPRRIGPTWTEFLRLQAYGLLSDSSRSDQDDNPEDVASDPPEAPTTPFGEDPATTEQEEPVHDDPSAPSPRILVTVHARRRAPVTVVPPRVGVRARDGPALAA
jgi:hypothetical protein